MESIVVFKDEICREYSFTNDGESIIDAFNLEPGSAVAIKYNKTERVVIRLGENNEIKYLSQKGPKHITIPFWTMMLNKWDDNLFANIIRPHNFTCNIIFLGVLVVKNMPIQNGDNVVDKSLINHDEPYNFIIYDEGKSVGSFKAMPNRSFSDPCSPINEELTISWDSQLILMQVACRRKK